MIFAFLWPLNTFCVASYWPERHLVKAQLYRAGFGGGGGGDGGLVRVVRVVGLVESVGK